MALAMPILVINMGGEMVYILEQRLEAQNVPREKGLRGARCCAQRAAATQLHLRLSLFACCPNLCGNPAPLRSARGRDTHNVQCEFC